MDEDNTVNENTANDLDDTAQSEGESQVPAQPQDNDTPFSPPTDVPASDVPAEGSAGSEDVDSHEAYDEGAGGAAETEEPAEPEEPEEPAEPEA